MHGNWQLLLHAFVKICPRVILSLKGIFIIEPIFSYGWTNIVRLNYCKRESAPCIDWLACASIDTLRNR